MGLIIGSVVGPDIGGFIFMGGVEWGIRHFTLHSKGKLSISHYLTHFRDLGEQSNAPHLPELLAPRAQH